MSLQQQLLNRCGVLKKATFLEVTPRLLSILAWMEAQGEIKKILNELRADNGIIKIIAESGIDCPPQAADERQIAGVGLILVDSCAGRGMMLGDLAIHSGIDSPTGDTSLQSASDAAMERYVGPFLDYVLNRLPPDTGVAATTKSNQPFVPVAIQESLSSFLKDHPDSMKTCFIMMQFCGTASHNEIEQTIKATLSKFGLTGLLARDKQYHEDLYPNIQTYMHGCGFGIAVFERIERDDFNPNVSLEVGYMLGLKKGVLLLKEKTLKALQADLVGKLYHPFDVQKIAISIPKQVEHWMEDRGLV